MAGCLGIIIQHQNLSNNINAETTEISNIAHIDEITLVNDVKSVVSTTNNLCISDVGNILTVPEVIYKQLTISVKPYDPNDDITTDGKLTVTVKKVSKDITSKVVNNTLKVSTLANPSIQTVMMFCPIDLIKSCFGSGNWIKYRPWLSREGWKYVKI